MDAGTEAAEQLVRMTLQGSEVVLRLSGAGTKNLAAALMAAASSAEQTKGKTRLATMLKSGKELKVFQIPAAELKAFSAEAKRYGVLYVVVQKSNPDGNELVDLMVKSEDASKLNRIIDKLEFGRVDSTDVANVSTKSERNQASTPATPDLGVEDKDTAAKLVDELLTKPIRATSERNPDPLAQTPQIEHRSGTISEKSSTFERGTTKTSEGKRAERESVRAKIKKIEQARKTDMRTPTAPALQTQHQQPEAKGIRNKQQKGR